MINSYIKMVDTRKLQKIQRKLDHLLFFRIQNQEFSFADPMCRMLLNKIYNCPFTGCQTWDLLSQGAERFYSTYNRSVKVMAD